MSEKKDATSFLSTIEVPKLTPRTRKRNLKFSVVKDWNFSFKIQKNQKYIALWNYIWLFDLSNWSKDLKFIVPN